MTTAMTVYSSDGCEGRCDANCHEAKEPFCDCICGGKNHGLGSSEAAISRQTREYFGSLEAAATWAREHGIAAPKVKAAGMGRRRLLEPMLRPTKVRAEALRRDQVELAL